VALPDIIAHSLADIFPPMSESELASLVADVSTNGLVEPIVLLDGQILDGRNRYSACKLTHVEPRFADFVGDDPLAFVISANLHRRHLSESQRAVVGARLANMRQGERTDLSPSAKLRKVSQTQAARLLNVSERTLQSSTTAYPNCGTPSRAI
jgi:ParB-like chromosome segregation protein Spo0J